MIVIEYCDCDFCDVVFPSIVSLADADIKQPVKLVLIGDSIYQDELKLKICICR